MKTLLLPGSMGYIGSHSIIALYPLIKESHHILIIDNLQNSSIDMLNKIFSILDLEGHKPQQIRQRITFKQGDVLDMKFLQQTFQEAIKQDRPVQTIIHYAAKKAVFQSTQKPLQYFQTNVVGSLNLLKCLQKYNVSNFIFSSSASVYGNGGLCTEESPLGALSPYGDTKHMVEIMMKGMGNRYKQKSFLALRYFNPIGAHRSGIIGDMPLAPNNLFPVIEQVIMGKRQKLTVFGNDYSTKDGSGIRDYIHIQDLAEGHAAAFSKIKKFKGYHVVNLGTGSGNSVLQIIQTYRRVNKVDLPYEITGRRTGDVQTLIALVGKSQKQLQWKCKRTIEDACRDSFNYLKQFMK